MRFNISTDNDSEKTFFSKKLNNSDWDYWLGISVVYLRDATGEEDAPVYEVGVFAVSPQAAGEEKMKEAAQCCCGDDYVIKTELEKAEILADYGISATLWYEDGNNLKKLFHDAHEKAPIIEMMFGFYMDKRQNMIGNDGWDFISGNIGYKKEEVA
jgi:hypothetical protein